ncbi:MAG: hypothetical protein HZA03_07540 [Nitrospinae bacterium]|nr:hypothetical protein [Nitrospinota bacterium]
MVRSGDLFGIRPLPGFYLGGARFQQKVTKAAAGHPISPSRERGWLHQTKKKSQPAIYKEKGK